MRRAAPLLCKQSTQKHRPLEPPASLIKEHRDGEAPPDSTPACSKRQPGRITQTRHGPRISTVNPPWKKQVRCKRECASDHSMTLPPGQMGKFTSRQWHLNLTWTMREDRPRRGHWDTNCPWAGDASFPKSPSTKMPAPRKQDSGCFDCCSAHSTRKRTQ